jgi:hypothetical protein
MEDESEMQLLVEDPPVCDQMVRSMGNRVRGFTDYGIPILNDPELAALVEIAEQVRDLATLIHGDRAMSTIDCKSYPTTLEPSQVSVMETLLSRGLRLARQFAKPQDEQMSADLCVHAVNFVYTPPNAVPQRWHFDSWHTYPVLSLLVVGSMPTQFANTTWHDVSCVPSPQAMRELDVPRNWATLSVSTPRADDCGNGVLFWSNCIHRGPAWPADEALTERVTMQIAFVPRGESEGKDLTGGLIFNEHWLNELEDDPEAAAPATDATVSPMPPPVAKTVVGAKRKAPAKPQANSTKKQKGNQKGQR